MMWKSWEDIIHALLSKYFYAWLCQILVVPLGIFSCGMWDLVP